MSAARWWLASSMLLAGGAMSAGVAGPETCTADSRLPAAPARPADAAEPQPEGVALRKRLAAQESINAALRQRVAQLEALLQEKAPVPAPPVATASAAGQSKVEADTPAPATALDQALGQRGLVLLPAGALRVTPSVAWMRSGAQASQVDVHVMGLGLDAGLPGGWMVSAQVPYLQRTDASWGRNRGLGDISLSLSRQLVQESGRMPAIVAQLQYGHDNGRDAMAAVPIGGGFKSLTGTLSVLKRIAPVALHGSLSYTRFEDKFFDLGEGQGFRGHIRPGDNIYLGAGVSLAATPDVSLSAGLTLASALRARFRPVDGPVVEGMRSSAVYFNLGGAFLLTPKWSLSVSASAGLTQGANDFALGVALPYRF